MRNGPVNVDVARALLKVTAANNATTIIGGPHSPVGYSLSGALNMLERCDQDSLRVDTWFAKPALIARLPGFGEHVWYLNLATRKEDPWA